MTPTVFIHFQPSGKLLKHSFVYLFSDSGPKSSAEEDEVVNEEGSRIRVVPNLNSPDSISEGLLNPILGPSPKRYSQTLGASDLSKRNPSPYYYSDLLKNRENNNVVVEPGDRSKKRSAIGSRQLEQQRLQEEDEEDDAEDNFLDPFEEEVEYQNTGVALEQQRFTLGEEGGLLVRCQSPLNNTVSSTTTSDDSDCSECQKRREWHAQALALVQQSCNVISKVTGSSKRESKADSSKKNMAPRKLLGPTVCACAAPSTIGDDDDVDELFRPRSIFYVHKAGEQGCVDCLKPLKSGSVDKLQSDDDIPRITRKLYETSFDTNARSIDDLDNMDNSVRVALTPHSTTSDLRPNRNRSGKGKQRSSKNSSNSNHSKTTVAVSASTMMISHDLENVLHLRDSNDKNNNNNNNTNSSNHDNTTIKTATTITTENNNLYNPSPPSTAPLPIKFPSNKQHDNRYFMNSIKSAPNLPTNLHPKLIKSLQMRELKDQSKAPGSDRSYMDNSAYDNNKPSTRPRSVILESGRVLELKRSHHKGRNFSSTESMATSDSGGSMESIRSSTSEGNRSTSSCESRHSSSMSSHSSDSHSSAQNPLRSIPLLLHSKLHILSPISDKSSQEPGSEISDQQYRKTTPEDHQLKVPTLAKLKEEDSGEGNNKNKRRLPQNKNLLLVAGAREEIQGSDSGISLHSRDGSGAGTRSAFQSLGLTKFNPTTEKVENKLLLGLTNSGSNCNEIVIAQDLKDLPFDMPKLRRRRGVANQVSFNSVLLLNNNFSSGALWVLIDFLSIIF